MPEMDWQQGSLFAPERLEDWTPETVESLLHATLRLWGAEELIGEVKWCWNPRLRTTIGRAIFDDQLVELNPHLLARHPGEVRGVLIHELAHLVVVARHGFAETAHGPRWKALMRAAGESTRATHQLEVGDLRRRRPSPRARDPRMRTVARLEAWWLRLRRRGW